MRQISWILGIAAVLVVARGVESAPTNLQQGSVASKPSTSSAATGAPQDQLQINPGGDLWHGVDANDLAESRGSLIPANRCPVFPPNCCVVQMVNNCKVCVMEECS